MINSLYALPCFSHVEHVSEITAGTSQSCFKVHADNKVFFAKTIASHTEPKVALNAFKKGFSPSIIYYDEHWLITEFINADTLVETTITSEDKTLHAIKLMVQCHQLNTKPAELTPSTIIKDLISKTYFESSRRSELYHLAESVLSSLGHSNDFVCCHGDLNFSNVLIDQERKAWLVDYECACSAPVEYDLAMFIAVNNMAESKIAIIIEQYEQQACSVQIDTKRLYNYLAFSYFINSIWYIQAYQTSNNITLFNLHQQQWEKFTSLVPSE